jgi:protein-S-isoprenylcysteine O-methyltransferase Ste14
MTAQPPSRRAVARSIVRFVVYVALNAGALFLAAGRWDWGMGWAYVGLTLVFTVGTRALIALKDPELLAERSQYREKEDIKAWDRYLVPLVALYGPLAMLITAGLDERWNGSPPIARTLQLVATLVVIVGYGGASWAMLVNRFFAAVVRIQKERGHAVVTHGPYRLVRHPGYAGAALGYLATPIMLGSLWALIPSALTVAGLVVRTALEDRTLHEELDGYPEYARRTRYRLLPGVW